MNLQTKKDLSAYGFVITLSAGAAVVASLAFIYDWDVRAIAAVAASFGFASAACKLVGKSDDLSAQAKDELALWTEALALFGGSGGVVAIVGALSG